MVRLITARGVIRDPQKLTVMLRFRGSPMLLALPHRSAVPYAGSMRIGVAGIAGRMGRLVAEEVAATGAILAGGTVRNAEDATPPVFRSAADLAAVSDVIIDFSTADAAETHAGVLQAAGTAWVVGTTGLSLPPRPRCAARPCTSRSSGQQISRLASP